MTIVLRLRPAAPTLKTCAFRAVNRLTGNLALRRRKPSGFAKVWVADHTQTARVCEREIGGGRDAGHVYVSRRIGRNVQRAIHAGATKISGERNHRIDHKWALRVVRTDSESHNTVWRDRESGVHRLTRVVPHLVRHGTKESQGGASSASSGLFPNRMTMTAGSSPGATTKSCLVRIAVEPERYAREDFTHVDAGELADVS